jgi:hypothetical protein
MKRFVIALFACLCVVALGSAAFADDTSNTSSSSHEMTGGKKVTLTGNVVDLSCYIASNASGSGHKACAKACLLNGNAFGIQTADGNIVTVFGTGPNDKPNAKLLPFVEDKVTVTGMEFTGHGVTGIRIDTIAAAQ